MICNQTSLQTEVHQLCRRSARLQNREDQIHMTWCIQTEPLGYFSLLPTELMYHIFNTLAIEDLGFLGITSKALRDVVCDYINSNVGLKRLQPRISRKIQISRKSACKRRPTNSCTGQLNHFRNVGLLLKRTTCLFPTRERLRILEYFVSKFQSVHMVFTCQALSCYGNMLSTFIRGWEERECLRAYVTVSENQNMTCKILMLSGSPGSNPVLETRTRRFFRHVLLNQCKTVEDLSMWLHFILKPFPMVHQARLLYLLYGPLRPNTDVVHWSRMSEFSISGIQTYSRTTAPLSEIAMALKALVTHREWTDDDVISVLEELTCCPDEWLIENIARLLILCGEPIALKVLGSKAINGKMSELGNTVVAFSAVVYDEGLNMSWLINMVEQLCSMMKTSQDVRRFLASITSTYKDYIISLTYSTEEEADSRQDLHQVAMAQADFMQGMMLQLFNASTTTPLARHS